MIDISPITRLISALRAQTSANSITPEGLGSILQKITDLIGALSQVPEQEATSLTQRVAQCESDCETARLAAQAAAATAAGNVISELGVTRSSTTVTITITQESGNSVSESIPAATTSYAGLLSASDKTKLNGAYNKRLKQLTTTSTDATVKLNYKCEDDTIKELTFVGATSLTAGLMTAADKVKLDNLDTTVSALQTTVNGMGTKKADLALQGNLSMLDLSQWPRCVIKSATPGMSSTQGEVYLMTGMMSFDPVNLQVLVGNTRYDLGEPSEHVVYFARDTRKFYLWNVSMQEVATCPTIVNNCVTGGSSAILSAQQGVVLHGETQLNEARYRNLVKTIKNSNSLSALQDFLNAADANTYYPLTLHLTGCTLQEDVPAYIGPMDIGTTVKVKAKTGYELTVYSVTIYDGEGVAQENDITHDIFNDNCIQYDAVTGLLTVTLEDPGRYDIFIQATPES